MSDAERGSVSIVSTVDSSVSSVRAGKPSGLGHYAYHQQPLQPQAYQPQPPYGSYTFASSGSLATPASSVASPFLPEPQPLPLPAMSTGTASSLTVPHPSGHTFDTTGQIAPPGMKPRVTATLWEDEGSLCFQVEAKGVCVARREDNHMINGSKLLNVAGMTRGRRDGILKSEKTRHVVKIGPMHLKGVWIPFDRALDFANKEKITEQLYPLFVYDIGAFLYHPSNQPRSEMANSSALAAVDQRRSDNRYIVGPQITKEVPLHRHRSMSDPTSGQPQHSLVPHLSSGRPGSDRSHIFPTLPTRASSNFGVSNLGSSYEQDQTGYDLSSTIKAAPSTQKPYFGNVYQVMEPRRPLEHHFSHSQITSILGWEDIPSVNANQSRRLEIMPDSDGSSKDRIDCSSETQTVSPSSPKERKSCESATDEEIQLPSIHEPKITKALHSEEPLLSSPSLDGLSENFESDTLSQTNSDNSFSQYPSECREDELLSPEEQKHALVNRLMKHFFLCFDPRAAFRSRGPNNHPQTNTTFNNNNSTLSGGGDTSSSIRTNNNGKRNRVNDSQKGQESDEDGDDGRMPKRPRPNDKNEQPEPKCRKYACPFYKRNPSRYHSWRQCPGPGWDTVHRLKEHLYRRHSLPIQCRRCREKFKSDIQLEEHQRAQISCEMRVVEPAEGFSIIQEKQLRSRKKSKPDVTEVERWAQVYEILFPDDDPRDMPSPFYDLFEKGDNARRESAIPAELAEYALYLENELPTRLRQELVVAVERELEPVEERLKIQLPDIVRIVHRELFQSFQQARLSPTQPGTSRASVDQQLPDPVTTAENQNLLQPLAFQLVANDDQLEWIWDESFAIGSVLAPDDFTFQAQSYTNNEGHWSDTGYGTIPNSSAAVASENLSESHYNDGNSFVNKQALSGNNDFGGSSPSTIDAEHEPS